MPTGMNVYLAAPNAIRRRLSEESLEGKLALRFRTDAELSLQRIIQDQANAEPNTDVRPQYHTGRLPNRKLGDNKPRLLLMGQKR